VLLRLMLQILVYQRRFYCVMTIMNDPTIVPNVENPLRATVVTRTTSGLTPKKTLTLLQTIFNTLTHFKRQKYCKIRNVHLPNTSTAVNRLAVNLRAHIAIKFVCTKVLLQNTCLSTRENVRTNVISVPRHISKTSI